MDRETQPQALRAGETYQNNGRAWLGTKATRHEIISKLYSRLTSTENPCQPQIPLLQLLRLLKRYSPTITKPGIYSCIERIVKRCRRV